MDKTANNGRRLTSLLLFFFFFFFLTGKNQRLGVYNTSSEMDRLSLINHGLRCTGLRIGTLLRNERMFCRKESSIKEAVPQ